MPWETIEHTADAGVRVRAAGERALFEEAARAVTDTITEVSAVAPREERSVEVEGIDMDDALVRFLGEIVYLYDVDRFLTAEASVESGVESLRDGRCRVRLRGEAFDPARHAIKTEVKAVTYHAGGIRRAADGVETDVIFDL